MVKRGTSTAVPRLRFPEFGNAWVADCVGNLGSFIGGGTPDKSVEAYWDGNIPWVSSSDLAEDNIYDLKVSRYITPAAVSASAAKVVPKGSLLFVSRVGVGKVAIADRDLCTSQDFTNFLPVRLLNSFVAYFFVANKWILKSFGQGTSIKGFAKDDLASFKLQFPELAEQQKIADCLTSLDEVIAAQGRIVAALKAHKRGLMQQLFPREGETRPRLRFPEFRNAPEWGQAPLRELFETSSGGTPDRGNNEYWGGAVPWVTTSLVDFNVITDADEFISEAGLQNSSAKVFPKGTVIVAMYGQGKTRGQAALLQVEAATNQACAAILPNGDIDPYFVFLSLCGRYRELRALSNSGGQENLSQGLIRELPFSYPTDLAEQSKIVACLSSLDAQIGTESHQLAALNTHKQGLMQQLFPSREVVAA